MHLGQSLPEYGYETDPKTGEVWYGKYEYQWVDGLGDMDGFLKKIFKKIKKVIKKVGKIVKKAAPYVAVGAAVYFGAPWFKALASKIGTGAATSIVRGGAGGAPPTSSAQVQSSMPGWVQSAAEIYMAQQRAKMQAQQATRYATMPGAAGFFSQPQRPYPVQYPPLGPYAPGGVGYSRTAPAKMPPWVIPVIAGTAALAILPVLLRR